MEKLYLTKLRNDIDERLYDLLFLHMKEAEDKISDYKSEFIKILETGIAKMKSERSEYNKVFINRHILNCCNKILRYDKHNQDIKDLKKEIIEDFINAEATPEDKIPLQYQINEVRITYDTDYLLYLIKAFIKQELWNKALYCLIAVRLIEPDNSLLDEFYKTIKENMPEKKLSEKKFGQPSGKVLALDSNVVISRIFYNVGKFYIPNTDTFDLEKLDCKFIITSSVQREVRAHMEFQKIITKSICNHKKFFDYDSIISTLEERYASMIDKYGVETVKVDTSAIESFYMDYLDVLEKIVLAKIDGKRLSHKLRKLAQRDSLLPEAGDMQLLAEVVSLNQEKEVGILSNDKDLTLFSGEIFDRFGVKVWWW